MTPLNNILQRRDELIQESHADIILGVYSWMLNRHNVGLTCGCDYCLNLRDYVQTKRLHQRFKQRLNSDATVYADTQEEFREVERLEYLGEHIKKLKQEKDSLKKVVSDYLPKRTVFDHTNLYD